MLSLEWGDPKVWVFPPSLCWYYPRERERDRCLVVWFLAILSGHRSGFWPLLQSHGGDYKYMICIVQFIVSPLLTVVMFFIFFRGFFPLYLPSWQGLHYSYSLSVSGGSGPDEGGEAGLIPPASPCSPSPSPPILRPHTRSTAIFIEFSFSFE